MIVNPFRKKTLVEQQDGINIDKPEVVVYDIERKIKSGINWFYWIAGLSLINTITFFSNTDSFFVAGLGGSLLLNSFAVESSQNGLLLNVLNILLIALFVSFGYFGRKYRKLIILGIVLYSIDSLIFLLFQDWFSILFHVFALFGIIRGLKAIKELESITSAQEEKNSETQEDAINMN